MDTCLRRYDLVLVDACPYHRKYDAEVPPSGYRIAHATFERRPCEGRGPSQQRSIKISAANKSIRYAHVDTCLRRYDLVLANVCHYRNQDTLLTSDVTPAKAGVHLSNEVLKLALLTKAFATLSWIPACAGMTSFWLMLAPTIVSMTLRYPLADTVSLTRRSSVTPAKAGSISATQYKN
jgi:hypothetical protein